MKAESQDKMKKIQQEARQHILERGKIEFRVDSKLMATLLDLAKEKKMPLGPMVREWVQERSKQEGKQSPSQLDIIEQKLDRLLSSRHKASA